MMKPMNYAAADLLAFADQLLQTAGLSPDKAQAVAEVLLEGDLLGHTTHGLALLAPYLAELEAGKMRKEGQPLVVSDHPAAVTWDGQRLPGPWLVRQAIDLATERARTQGTCTVVIRRSHHIACLAVYHQRVTDLGLMMLLHCSDPNTASIAPFGGLDPVFTPNPMSVGIPTSGLPVLIDVSTSSTTNGMTNRLHKEGGLLPAEWVMDGHGQPSRDPAVLFNEPKGTILPLGGMDSGHKGYGLSWMVEALTGGLAGHGRADPPEGWGATVFLQIIDPRAFSGQSAFNTQMDEVSRQCHASRPAKADRWVRTPGERGLKLKAGSASEGVALYPNIMPMLLPWADKLKVAAPQTL
jgi:LDH2 family malate/lactate/ureidoglycolate dehydrogenase